MDFDHPDLHSYTVYKCSVKCCYIIHNYMLATIQYDLYGEF